eukprot:SRR837773.6867.p1 GENE.SRR837773.6867~~SRR837773.6867.p1  ORF type:complete len:275 (+),score=32.79 SRR837773.6867:110-826(+)
MAVSLFITERLCSLTSSLAEENLFWVFIAVFAGGVLTSSRWLFLIWNFSEDFHGGFQVGTRRVALIESSRQAVAGVLAAAGEHAFAFESFMLSFIVLLLIILVLLAPTCYSSYVLPTTNFKKDVRKHKVYLLMIGSMAINGLGVYCWGASNTWIAIDGWRSEERALIHLISSVVMILCLFAIFVMLQHMTTWGPWPMRDFVCFLPPGSFIVDVCILGNWRLALSFMDFRRHHCVRLHC